MNKEQKKKLGVLAILGLALLVGGTFAFTAFNQKAINDRQNRVDLDVGGRVHDYYNRDTENKDVFVENYGQEPIMARIRLSEFLEIQRDNATEASSLVEDAERENLATWTTYIPSATDIGTRTGNSAAFNRYSQLTFGWSREGQIAPWYLPTFNHNNLDLMTAAAGHARDYIAGNGATDGTTEGATHPGEGTDNFWSEGDSYDNDTGTWPGSMVTREAAQNLQQERPPMTLQQWAYLRNEYKIGDFWVMDQETGWAYWASRLEVGETTSYLLDAAEMTEAIEQTVFNGTYYYGIHVDSELISPGMTFSDEASNTSGNLNRLLLGIRNNAVDDTGENPGANVDAPPSAFNFSTMNPGRVFTMAGEQFRYLEDMGSGNHLIIRNQTLLRADGLLGVNFNNQDTRINTWYEDELAQDIRDITQPVADSFTTGRVRFSDITFTGTHWLPNNLHEFPEVANDITRVVPEGRKRAFSLSLADVTRLSGPGRGFANSAQRSVSHAFWWLRTPDDLSLTDEAWIIRGDAHPTFMPGELSHMRRTYAGTILPSRITGPRPALIIHQ